MTHPEPIVHVFHTGALGDSILLWPMLRRLRASSDVTLLTDRSKGKLAASELGVHAVDLDQPKYAAFWRDTERQNLGHQRGTISHRAEGSGQADHDRPVSRVISFLTEDASGVWARNARRHYPNARLELHRAPVERPAALELGGSMTAAGVEPDGSGPVVFHVGAGSRDKRWSMQEWDALVRRLQRSGSPGVSKDTCCSSHARATVSGDIAVIAGEVEDEQFTRVERDLFLGLGGRFIPDLESLASTLRGARVFIGNDSGPTHLAAQLGVPTVALFGPTDPGLWAPIGPRVTVIAPRSRSPMSWLSAEHVAGTISA